MKAILDWLDDRTGYRALLNEALYERIPGGARWRYVWGSTLMFAMFVQFVTGIVLWAAYSANAQGAWESVYYIQNEMWAGWLLRGIHHYMAQVTIVLLLLHLMQVVIDGAYRAPREVNFWFGVGLLGAVLGLSLTGYLLPWDQKGYWATKVATSIASITPVIGPSLQRLLIGGAEYGHHTLTRFFALHAGVLPGIIVLLTVGHIYLFRRHGVTVRDPDRAPETTFWPEQVFRDSVASLAVMATVLILVLWTGGAHLGAPADATEPYSAARPEWYFMFLFQWLKYFPAGWEVVGAMVIPGAIATAVVLMPIIGSWRLGHRFNVGLAVSLLLGIGLLTRLGYSQDGRDPEFLQAKAQAEVEAVRVGTLASAPDGIPPGGALALMRTDPVIRGPKLFASNCASCHTYDGHDGLGTVPREAPTAADLRGFGSREWVTGLMDPDRFQSEEYFGNTEHARGAMFRFISRGLRVIEGAEEQLPAAIAAVSAEAQLLSQADLDAADQALITAGQGYMTSEGGLNCTNCHSYRGFRPDDPSAPTLDGWGSRAWMIGMVSNPNHPMFYGDDNDRMPAFAADDILTLDQIGLVVDWLREDWYRGTEEPED